MAGFAALDHARHKGDHAVDDTAKIDPDQPVEIAIGGLFHRAETVHPGGVEQHGGRLAKDLLDLVGGAGIGAPVGDIQNDAMGSDALAAQLGQRGLDRIGAQVGDHDFRPGPSEHQRLSQTRARGAAGDKGQLPVEILHKSHPLLRCGRSAQPPRGRSG